MLTSAQPKSIIISKLLEEMDHSKLADWKVVSPINEDSKKNSQESINSQPDHTSEGYKCDYLNCEYKSKLSTNLTKHKRIHTDEKPYMCDRCSFRTNFISSLKVHSRIHTTERLYSCRHCEYKCNSTSNLKKHCLYKHKDVK